MISYLLALTSVIFSGLILQTKAQTTATCSFPFTTSTFPSATPCGIPIGLGSCSSDPHSSTNCNAVQGSLYPASVFDPSYSISEATLRAAIHIPSTYDNTKPAVILFPGTGLPTYDIYKDTIIVQLQRDGLNPVWVNPPFATTMFSTVDVQISSEFAAYAINYMYAMNGKKNFIVGASQGTINAQWAMKYWTSTRSKLAGFIALSGKSFSQVLLNEFFQSSFVHLLTFHR
jgi:hypothetical protein